MWTQLWGRLGPGNIVFCPKWDSVVEFVLFDLEGVCLAPFRPVSQASDLASLQDSLWLLRRRKFFDKFTCDFPPGGQARLCSYCGGSCYSCSSQALPRLAFLSFFC